MELFEDTSETLLITELYEEYEIKNTIWRKMKCELICCMTE